MDQVILLTNNTESPAVGVRLMFALSRTVVHQVDADGLPPNAHLGERNIVRNNIEIRWDGPLVPGRTISVRIWYIGEPLSLAQTVWLGEKAAENTLVTFGLQPTDARAGALRDSPLRESTLSPEEAFAVRLEAIAKTADPKIKRYQEFFSELDHNTHPLLVPKLPIGEAEKQRRRATIMTMAGVLTSRVLTRAQRAAQGGVPQPDDLKQSSIDDTRYVSALLNSIISKHFGAGSNLDVTSFGEAFELFANGELRVHISGELWNCEPDSAFEFSFAEFSLMAVNQNVEVQVWTSLLGPFVRSQPIFTAVYRPPGPGPYAYVQYGSANFRREHQLGESEKASFRAATTGKTVSELERLAGENAYSAFPLGMATLA